MLLRKLQLKMICRNFCAQAEAPIWRKLIEASTLSEFQSLLVSAYKMRVSSAAAVDLMKRCIELKNVNDVKYRGRIPTEIVRIVSDATVDCLDQLNEDSILTLVVGASDCNKSVDEYLLYRIARSVLPRIESFSIDQLITIATAYCKRDLMDLELLDAITGHLASISPDPPIGKLIHLLRAVSQVRLKPEALIQVIITRSRKERLLGKDAISLIIAMAELDIEEPRLSSFLWSLVEKHKLIFSHDDEYGLTFAYMRMKGSPTVITRIAERACRENRINKRIQLLRDCTTAGIVAVDTTLPQTRSGNKKEGSAPQNSMSSGLHLEVNNVLESMGHFPVLEVPAGSFILDTVLAS